MALEGLARRTRPAWPSGTRWRLRWRGPALTADILGTGSRGRELTVEFGAAADSYAKLTCPLRTTNKNRSVACRALAVEVPR